MINIRYTSISYVISVYLGFEVTSRVDNDPLTEAYRGKGVIVYHAGRREYQINRDHIANEWIYF